ncbi:MAG: VI polysaccharide biosynthesis protein VIPC/TVIE [Parcubacteria group bacterium GW2011_GWA1_36_12]|nr:MAG: VI polysaccharide biosynthesis protein VIPC/TVIE [Parcubacteria group bacterium GW2011_GWA1_36_12]
MKQDKKKLVICSPQLGLSPKSILGGEVFDRETLLGFARKGIQVEIILPKHKHHDDNIKNWNISYLPISKFPAVLGNILFLPYLFKVFQKNNFKIIRVHQPQFIGISALIFKFFKRKVKIIATIHKFEEANFGPLSKLINNLWDHIICDSEYAKSLIIENYGIKKSKILVVHNGAPNYLKPQKKDNMLVKKLNLEGKKVLLYMGLFIKRKNPLFLLDVLERLLTSQSDSILIYWGEGPLKNRIIQKSKKLKIYEHIKIINPVFSKEKNKIHNIADIFVHPSLDEGLALAPIESMACAKPIVITNGNSASELVESGINGFKCDKNNLNEWVDKLNILVSNTTLRNKMGQSSLSKIKEQFQWNLTVSKQYKLFQSLANDI